MKKIFKAFAIFILTGVIVLNPLMEIKVFAVNARMANIPETGTMSIAQLQQEFPTGAYWNHVSKDEENPSPYQVTDTPCVHNGDFFDRCNIFSVSSYGGYQCIGFAAMMSYLYTFGKSVPLEKVDFIIVLDYNEVQVGDCIGTYSHDVFVTEILGGNKVRVGEANYGDNCSIKWGRVVDVKALSDRRKDYGFIIKRPMPAGLFDNAIKEAKEEKGTVYRLYNPRTGAHAFVSYETYFEQYIENGWEKEKSAGKTPDSSNTPVYELINLSTGELLYTSDRNEYDTLNGNGWYNCYWESPAFYSADGGKNPVYRLNKPGSSGPASHHYTSDKNEIEVLIRDHGYVYDNGGNPVFMLM